MWISPDQSLGISRASDQDELIWSFHVVYGEKSQDVHESLTHLSRAYVHQPILQTGKVGKRSQIGTNIT